MNRRFARISAPAIALALALSVTGCANNQEAPADPEGEKLNQFCDTMAKVTDQAPTASAALNGFFDEMGKTDYLKANADLTGLIASGTSLVTAGNSYVTTLEAAKALADTKTHADFDAIIHYWTDFGIELGGAAENAEDYTVFVESIRPLIEAEEANNLREAQRSAAESVSAAYRAACATP